jgi:hypothetical protein
MKFTPYQRVYRIWMGVTEAVLDLHMHDGDQEWFSKYKRQWLARTTKKGRKFTPGLNDVSSMAADIMKVIGKDVTPHLVVAFKPRKKHLKAVGK